MVKNDKNHHADHKVKAAERNARREAAALRSSSTTAHEEPASSVSMIADNSIITTSTTTQPSSVGGGSNEQQNTSNPSSGSLSNTRPSKHRVKASERNSARREKTTTRSLTPPKRISPNRTTGRSLTPPGLDRKHYDQQRHERRKERGGPTATAASTTRRSAGSTTTNPSGDIHASLNDEHDNYNNEEEKEEYDDFSHAFEPGAVRVRFTDTEEGNDDDDGDVDNIDDMVKDMESQLQLNQQPIASVVAAEVAEDIDTLQKQKEQLQRELESIRQKQQGQRKSDVTTVAVEAKIVNTLPTTEENENNNIFKKRVACCCVVVVLIIVGLIIEVALSELENDDSDEPTGAPTGEEVNTFPPSRENPEGDVYITTKKELLIRDILEPVYGVIYAPSNSPQRFALEWLKSNADDDELILATNTTTTTTNTTNTTGVDAVITQSLVQHYALLVLYDATDGEHWTPSYAIVVEGLDRSGCNVNDNMPVGILCDENDIVRRMHLPNNNLRGTIPTEIGALSTLFELDLEENLVVGTIPTEIGNLSNLEILELQENSFEGNVPSEIGKISKLESLYLSDNSLTGSVPSSLSMLTNLYIVHLQRNIGLTAGVNEAFCNGDNTALLQLRADCIENEEICTCCTECCDSTQCCSTTDVGYCFNL